MIFLLSIIKKLLVSRVQRVHHEKCCKFNVYSCSLWRVQSRVCGVY